jgi:hypothetical protein
LSPGGAPEGGIPRLRGEEQTHDVSDLRERVPGHALVERLVAEWLRGRIHFDGTRATVDPEAQSWYRGVLGERIVAGRLALLGDDWLVLHSVPVGRADTDIDHVAIGPTGVFTVNTKYSPGKSIWAKGYGLYVDGQKTGYVPRAIREARGAADALGRATGVDVPVTALIVFVEPGSFSITGRVGGTEHDPEVRVMPDSAILRAFAGRPVLDRTEVQRLQAAAVNAETWHVAPRSTSSLAIAEEFAALEEAVGPSLARPIVAPSRAGRPVSSGRVRSRPPRAARSSSSRRRKSRPGPLEWLLGRLVALGAFVLIMLSAWWFLQQYVSSLR